MTGLVDWFAGVNTKMSSRILFATLFLGLVLLAFADQALIDSINNDPASTWRAGKTLSNEKMAAIKKSLLKKQSYKYTTPFIRYNVSLNDLPEQYSPDVKYPSCAQPIFNQGQCGSSWATPLVFTAQNRYCIAQVSVGKQVPPLFSVQYLISCDKNEYVFDTIFHFNCFPIAIAATEVF